MQRIERYGVIALVFLLVTILAVAVWGQRKNQSLLSFLKREKATTELADASTLVNAPLPGGPDLGLSTPDYQVQPTLPPAVSTPSDGSLAPDAKLQLAPPAGPNPNAVTFDQGKQLPGNPPTNNGFLQAQDNLGRLPGQIPVAPAQGAGARSYVVKNGDTLGSIAQRELGSTKRWKEIEALNGVKPERLAVGMTLKLPAGGVESAQPMLVRETTPLKPKPAAREPQAPAARTYTVRSGDSLSRIAAAQLGNADRHGEILALNPGVRPEKLSIGQVLRLPAGSAPAPKSASKARPESSTKTVAKVVDTPKKSKVQ